MDHKQIQRRIDALGDNPRKVAVLMYQLAEWLYAQDPEDTPAPDILRCQDAAEHYCREMYRRERP